MVNTACTNGGVVADALGEIVTIALFAGMLGAPLVAKKHLCHKIVGRDKREHGYRRRKADGYRANVFPNASLAVHDTLL
jgi:hypothetical protein